MRLPRALSSIDPENLQRTCQELRFALAYPDDLRCWQPDTYRAAAQAYEHGLSVSAIAMNWKHAAWH